MTDADLLKEIEAQRLLMISVSIGQATIESKNDEYIERRGRIGAELRHRGLDDPNEYDLELRRYDGRGWRAVFFPSGFEHSLTSHAGSAWARSPWEAVQRAAQDALHKLETGELVPRDWTVADESPA